jgi:RNA polymerase sigma factor (sigma-70 family)
MESGNSPGPGSPENKGKITGMVFVSKRRLAAEKPAEINTVKPSQPAQIQKPAQPTKRRGLEDLSEQELWKFYLYLKSVSSPLVARVKQFVIDKYMPDVERIANRYARKNLPKHSTSSPADVLQSALLAHVQTVDKYDLGHGTNYMQFAYRRINGGIIDSLRCMQDCRRSTPGSKRIVRKLQEKMSHELGHHVTIDEIIESYGNSILQVASDNMVFNSVYNNSSFASSENNAECEQDPISSCGSIDDDITRSENVAHSHHNEKLIMDSLGGPESQRLKDVIWLYYYMNMTTEDVAIVLECSISNVSAMKRKAIEKLKRKFTYKEFRDLIGVK